MNGYYFSELPCMCGACPCFSGRGYIPGIEQENRGFCTLFEKHKNRYNNVPLRCKNLIEKGLRLGGDLVIVYKKIKA